MPKFSLQNASPLGRAALAAAVVAIVALHYFFAKWGLANMASVRTDMPEVAATAVELAPGDPQTHYAAAVLYERTFLPEDQARALAEYEKAAALAPHNYLLWLALGTARSRAGDLDAAAAALERARQLAPNYSAVRWAIGNLMVRRGRTDEGFAEIGRAVAADDKLAQPAAVLAMQVLGAEPPRLAEFGRDIPALNAALALSLARADRFDEALELWRRMPADRGPVPADAARSLFDLLVAKHRYRAAREVTGARSGDELVSNGGFEDPISLSAPTPFEWQIASGGGQPQVVPVSGTRRTGDRSLALVFDLGETRHFRPVSQTIAVEPGAAYRFEAYYRAELRDSRPVKWEIVDAATGSAIAAAGPINTTTSQNWERLAVEFTQPKESDGVTIRLVPDGCAAIICKITGRVWLDDVSLKKR
ncbi:MAG: carbohydrate binding domain-containing protein [Pyrinomonadaceae bacterium]